jgi:hypothetical protein
VFEALLAAPLLLALKSPVRPFWLAIWLSQAELPLILLIDMV